MARSPLRLAIALTLVVGLMGCSSVSPKAVSTPGAFVEETPERILVVGNSLAYQVGLGVEAALKQAGVTVRNEAAPEIALWGERSTLADPKKEYQQYVKEFDPDVVLVTTVFVGPTTDCTGDSATVAACEKEAIRIADEYLAADLIETLSAGGATVVWIRNVTPGPFFLKRAPKALVTGLTLDEVMADIASRDDRLQVADYSRIVNLPGEEYSPWFQVEGKWRQMRAFDGLHFCQHGIEVITEYLAPLLDPGWSDADPSWRDGSWRENYLFNYKIFNGETQCTDDPQDAPIPSPLDDQPVSES